MTDAVPRKRPWELHAIVVLHALALGYAVSTYHVEVQHQMILAGMLVLLIGLFRGNRVAWWAAAVAFVLLTFLTLAQSGETIHRYGFRLHPKLLRIHAATALSLVSFGMLTLCWYRGAIPVRAAPLLEELPAVRKVVAVVAPLFFILAAIFSLSIVILFHTGRDFSERYASNTVRTLASAEADFRVNDRDENKINDFWTADVRGLYSIVNPVVGQPIKLIELSTAAADGNPTPASSAIPADISHKGGAWFSALVEDRTETPPEPYGRQNTSRFGFIAYPDDWVGGLKYAFILNENNTIFRRALTGDIRGSDKTPPGPLKLAEFMGWPSDDALKVHWHKLD